MKTIALIAGIFFLLLGIACFAGLASDGLLFGVFPAQTLHGVIYLVTGIAGIAIGAIGRRHIVPTRGTGHDMRDL
jgi:hypothetical protein